MARRDRVKTRTSHKQGSYEREHYRSSSYSLGEAVEGNTVRKLEAQPIYEPQPEIGPQEQRHQERIQRKREQARRARAVWDIPSLLFMVSAVAVCLYVCVSYIQVQEQITTMEKKAAVLESDIMDLKDRNDAAYNKVETSVDLSEVYRVAVKELGMVRASGSQIMSYKNIKSDFVRQYDEIPEEKTSSLNQLFKKETGGN